MPAWQSCWLQGSGTASMPRVSGDDRDDDRLRGKLSVIGLTVEGRLVSFRARSPEKTRDLGPRHRPRGNRYALVGIDFRVQDGKLYGVGNGGGVYTIDPTLAMRSSSTR